MLCYFSHIVGGQISDRRFPDVIILWRLALDCDNILDAENMLHHVVGMQMAF